MIENLKNYDQYFYNLVGSKFYSLFKNKIKINFNQCVMK